MASSNTTESSGDDVCPLCLDTFKNPVELPCCNKKYCIKCLEQWKPGFDNCVRGERGCPCCRALIPPTQDIIDTIELYTQVAVDSRALLDNHNHFADFITFAAVRQGQGELHRFFSDIGLVYGDPVDSFVQNYGASIQTIIPSSSPDVDTLPLPVVQALRNDDYMAIQRFLGTLPIPPRRLNARCPTDNGNTLLLVAVREKNLLVLEYLLSLGANVEACDNFELTPLHNAILMNGQDDAVAKTLIRWGASTNPFMVSVAEKLGKVELAKILRSSLLGRHCTIVAPSDGVPRRGFVSSVDISANICNVIMEDNNMTVRLSTDAIQVCKPRLFHCQVKRIAYHELLFGAFLLGFAFQVFAVLVQVFMLFLNELSLIVQQEICLRVHESPDLAPLFCDYDPMIVHPIFSYYVPWIGYAFGLSFTLYVIIARTTISRKGSRCDIMVAKGSRCDIMVAIGVFALQGWFNFNYTLAFQEKLGVCELSTALCN